MLSAASGAARSTSSPRGAERRDRTRAARNAGTWAGCPPTASSRESPRSSTTSWIGRFAAPPNQADAPEVVVDGGPAAYVVPGVDQCRDRALLEARFHVNDLAGRVKA